MNNALTSLYLTSVRDSLTEEEAAMILEMRRQSTARNPLSARFHAILKELGTLHDKKQADYGKPDDPFANVRASEEWGVRPWVGAFVRLTDKIKRLQSYARSGKLQNEGVIDSMRDISVYATIGVVLFEEEQGLAPGQDTTGVEEPLLLPKRKVVAPATNFFPTSGPFPPLPPPDSELAEELADLVKL